MTPQAKEKIPYNGKSWMERVESHQRDIDEVDPDILFIGDSLTEGFLGQGLPHWKRLKSCGKIVNLGIGGDKVENILWRIQHYRIGQPRLILLLAGTNNINRNSADEIIEGLRACIRSLQKKAPESTIILQHLLPRQAEASDPLYLKVLQINKKIPALAHQTGVRQATFHSLFLSENGEGHLHPDRMKADHVHLEEAGYRVWTDALLNFLKDL